MKGLWPALKVVVGVGIVGALVTRLGGEAVAEGLAAIGAGSMLAALGLGLGLYRLRLPVGGDRCNVGRVDVDERVGRVIGVVDLGDRRSTPAFSLCSQILNSHKLFKNVFGQRDASQRGRKEVPRVSLRDLEGSHGGLQMDRTSADIFQDGGEKDWCPRGVRCDASGCNLDTARRQQGRGVGIMRPALSAKIPILPG